MTSSTELNRFVFQSFAQHSRDFGAALAARESVAATGMSEQSGDGSLPTTQEGNRIVTRTPGGFTIQQTAGSAGEMIITSPKGDSVRVHGDPHVATKTDGQAKENEQFTFLNDSSLLLSDGTKISMATVPGPNGQTLLGGTTITNGRSGFSTSGLSSSNAEISRGGDGRLRDALTNDGMRVHMGDHARLTGDNGSLANQSYVNDNDSGSLWGHIAEMTAYVNDATSFEW